MTEESSKLWNLRLHQAAEGLKQAFVNAAEGFARFGSALAGMYPRGDRHPGFSEQVYPHREFAVRLQESIARMDEAATPRVGEHPPEEPETCTPPVPMKRLLELS